MPRRSTFRTAAIVLLLIASFGGLSVGVPLVIAQLTDPTVAGLGPEVGIVPAIALAYGLLSLAGAVGIWIGWSLSTALVLVTQGFVALALLAIYATQAPDWSLLAVAAIAGGAAICALMNARMTGRT